MPPDTLALKCPTCGAPFTQRYCSRCGEKKRGAHDFSVKHFIEETVEGFTHMDNKFIRTVKMLFFKPGSLTAAFEQGQRVNYMKPVQLFIICNLIFFLLAGSYNVFTVPLENYLNYGNFTRWGTGTAFYDRFREPEEIKTAALLFREKISSQSKTFIFLFIPVVALACSLHFSTSASPTQLSSAMSGRGDRS